MAPRIRTAYTESGSARVVKAGPDTRRAYAAAHTPALTATG